MKKNYLLFLIGIVLILTAACSQQPSSSTSTVQTAQPQQGRAVFAITDAAANMGAVTSVMVTVDGVKVHSETKGWITVSSTQKTYDLLKLKAEGKQELLADAQLDEGTYNQIRLDISKVVVTDAQGSHDAKLPSGELKINGNLVVGANSTSTANLDFIADESLHVTGNGKYIMAPVVQVETRENAYVEVKANNKVEIKSGKVKTNAKVGMDLNGNVGVGVKVPADVDISIDAAGAIKIGGKSSTKVKNVVKGNTIFTITDAAANMGAVTSVKITFDKISVHSEVQGWVDVSTTPQTFDLLELKAKGEQALIASANLKPGFYDQLRLDVSKVMVTDANGEHEAKLPSSELKIFGTLVVNEFNTNLTSTAQFDFMADKSLHVTGKGEYIMAPVVKLETKEMADVEIKSDGKVDVKGGAVKTTTEVGMNADGDVGVGLEIPANAEVSIESGRIKAKTKVVVNY